MKPRIIALIVLAVLLPEICFAQEDYNFTRDIGGAKTDSMTRDNHFVNDATTAQERAVDAASRDRENHVQPEHRVILRDHHGLATPTDIYLIPAGPEERSETGQ